MGNGARDGQRRAGWATARGMGNGARDGQRRAGWATARGSPVPHEQGGAFGFAYASGGSLQCVAVGFVEKPFYSKGLWPIVDSPPATEVCLRYAPTQVASLINGNGVVDRKLLMSGGAAVASSCEAGPLSPGGDFSKMRGFHKAENV